MRVTIKIDSATTAELRPFLAALHRAGHTAEATVGVEGPECWNATSPALKGDAAANVLRSLSDDIFADGGVS